MLDFAKPNIPSATMSRKRTRSRSEDSIFNGGLKRQPALSICNEAPFSHEYDALSIRNSCNYDIKITEAMAKNGNTPRPVRVYADGAYDLFHLGHARQMQQAKNAFANVYLIAGVCSDALLHKVKGKTVMNESERYEAIRHCRYVDEVLCDAPWVITDDFLEKNKIDFVAHDASPYPCGEISDVYGDLKAKGMFIPTLRTEGVSTSDIVARIVRDYDVYLRRNLARGYSAKDLNISLFKEKTVRLKGKMDELKDKGMRVLSTGEKTGSEEKLQDFVDGFLRKFYNETLKHVWSDSRNKVLNILGQSDLASENTADSDYDDQPSSSSKKTNEHL